MRIGDGNRSCSPKKARYWARCGALGALQSDVKGQSAMVSGLGASNYHSPSHPKRPRTSDRASSVVQYPYPHAVWPLRLSADLRKKG